MYQATATAGSDSLLNGKMLSDIKIISYSFHGLRLSLIFSLYQLFKLVGHLFLKRLRVFHGISHGGIINLQLGLGTAGSYYRLVSAFKIKAYNVGFVSGEWISTESRWMPGNIRKSMLS